MTTVTCPDPTCDEGEIEIPEGTIIGDVLECEHCAAEVEVVNDDPYQVTLIVEEK